MHIIKRNSEGDPYLGVGTSFAAPLVSGSLACVFSELQDLNQSIPEPSEVRDAVRRSSYGISDMRVGKYDAMGVRRMLGIV